MNSKILAANYSLAIFKAAVDSRQEKEIFDELSTLSVAINSDLQVREFMRSPIVSARKKAEIIEKLGSRFKIQNIAWRFLLLLVKNARIPLLPTILGQYNKLLKESRGIKLVKVTSSKPLNSLAQTEVENYLMGILKKKVEIEFTADESIIGGLMIQYDSTLIDSSIADRLERIGEIGRCE